MTNKEKIDYLLIDLRELENLIASMKEVDFYPASFFNQTFQLTHKIFTELHSLENLQLETLRQQMEEHQRLIDSLQQPQPLKEVVLKKPEEKQADETKTIIREEIIEEPKLVEKVVVTPIESPQETTIIVEEPVQSIVQEEKTIEPTPNIETVTNIEPKTKTVLADKSSVSLNDLLEKKNLSDFRKAFSLNDRFRFRRELFGGNETKMNQAISDLNEITSFEESVEYLNNQLKWNIEDASVTDFLKLLEKRFS